MLQKWLAAVCCILYCGCILDFIELNHETIKDGSQAAAVFAEMELDKKEILVEFNGKCRTIETRDREELLKETAYALQVPENHCRIQKEEKKNGTVWTLQAEHDYGKLQIQSILLWDGFSEEDYMTIRLSLDSKWNAAPLYRDWMQELADQYDLEGVPCIRFQGILEAVMEPKEQAVFGEQLLKKFGASLVSESDEETYLAYGINSSIQTELTWDGNTTNINLLLRPSEEGTVCMIGIPLIFDEETLE